MLGLRHFTIFLYFQKRWGVVTGKIKLLVAAESDSNL